MYWVHKHRMFLAVLTGLLLSVQICGVLLAQTQVGDSKKASASVSIDVIDAPLSQVVRLLINDSNRNIIIADPDIQSKKITACLNDLPFEVVLKQIVKSSGCKYEKDENGIYVISKADAKTDQDSAVEPNNGSAPLSGGNQSTLKNATTVTEAPKDTKVESIKLYNISAVDAMWALGLYKFTVEDANKIAKSANKPGVYLRKDDGSLEPMVVPGTHAAPVTESKKETSPVEANRATAVGSEAKQYPPTPFPGGSTNRPNTPTPTTSTSPGAANSQQNGLLPQSITFVMPYETDNSLLVRGDEEGIQELKNIISMLDIAPKQISIKAEFVSISTSTLESLGINWDVSNMGTNLATNFSPAGNVTLGFASGNILANLKAQLTSSDGKLINAPLVTTINNVPATISFDTQVPYLNTTTVYNTNGTPTTNSWVDTIDVTSELYVLPRVNNADNSITVQIQPQIADIENYVNTGQSSLPIIDTQSVQTIRRVANGETIVLGGLLRRDQKASADKIPLLGDLPIIGKLFQNTSHSTDDKELLILLTPTIVSEKPIAGSGVGVQP